MQKKMNDGWILSILFNITFFIIGGMFLFNSISIVNDCNSTEGTNRQKIDSNYKTICDDAKQKNSFGIIIIYSGIFLLIFLIFLRVIGFKIIKQYQNKIKSQPVHIVQPPYQQMAYPNQFPSNPPSPQKPYYPSK